ncbi:hypothetical protein EC991_004614 [Linnemannia zychae]|nr:hypothetical protein EC991_004614 [Linnemannia zychae]
MTSNIDSDDLMSTSSSVTFFRLPELASLLASFLRASDISNLMQTSRAMNNILHTCFWHHIELVSEEKIIRLIKSPDAFSALVKNFDRIRSLKITLVFLCYQHVAALEYMERGSNGSFGNDDKSDDDESDEDKSDEDESDKDKNDEVEHDMDENDEDKNGDDKSDDNTTTNAQPLKQAKPSWLPSPTYRSQMFKVEPLPLFTHLKRLDLNLESIHGGRYLSFAINMYNNSPLILTACWLLGLNPGLTDVRLHGFDLPSPLCIRVLARSLSRLNQLQNLELKASSLPSFYDVAKVFFALPQSTVSFKWKGELNHFAPIPDLQVSSYDADWNEGLVGERAEPLQNLTMLELPFNTTGYLHHQLKHIFKHCPMLELLEFPFVNPTDSDCDATAEEIKMACPRIRHVFVGRQYRDGSGRCLLGMTENLPRHQLETLYFTGILDEAPGRLVLTVTSHSESLRKIVFREAIRLQSKGIQEILTGCKGLSHFEISGTRHSRLAIALADAIAAPWVCTKLKYLGLSVDLGVYNGPQSEEEKEKNRWVALETLYKQLGSLIKLETLELNSVGIKANPSGPEFDLPIESRLFPRLLILEDKATDRRGYLSLLTNLKELRELRGSIRLSALEWSLDPSATVGQAEVEWIAEHWKNLRLVALLPDNHDKAPMIEVPAPLQWLQAQMPDLKLSRHFIARYHSSLGAPKTGSRTFTAGSIITAGSASGATTTATFTTGSTLSYVSVDLGSITSTAAPVATTPSGFTAAPMGFSAGPVTTTTSSTFTAGPVTTATSPTLMAGSAVMVSTATPTTTPSLATSQPVIPQGQP